MNQTYDDWEWVVYDNGKETVEDLLPEDSRVKYVQGPNLGMAADWQAALDLATGQIVTPLSDDDRLPRHALDIAVETLGAADWLNGRTVLVNEAGDPLHLRGGVWDHVQDTKDGSFMLGGAVYWRRSLTERMTGFQSEFDGAGDVDLYGRFLKHCDPVRTKEILLIHTVWAGQDSLVNQPRQADAARRAVERSRLAA